MRKKLLITGASGLVGSAVMSLEKEYPEFLFKPIYHSHGDLANPEFVETIFDLERPDLVLHLAAKVGGIMANLSTPVQQYEDNILMNIFVVREAFHHKVKNFIGFGSVCAFPSDAELLTEDIYLQGEPYPAHKSYAYAKRMLSVQLESYKQQYDFNSCIILPTNIIGEHDNYNLENGHVVASLTHKFYNAYQEAFKRDSDLFDGKVTIWGTGKPEREFIYSKDLARICLDLLKSDKPLPSRLIVPGKTLQIKDIVHLLDLIFEKRFKNLLEIEYDQTKPDGQKKRPTDAKLFNSIFPDFKYTDFYSSLKDSVEWFINEYPNVRR